MTRFIIAILFVFLGLSFPGQCSQGDEPSNVGRANILLRDLVEKPSLETLTTFNKLAADLKREELDALNQDHIQTALNNPICYNNPVVFTLGMIPAQQEEVKQSLILWAKLVDFIKPGASSLPLSFCAMYRSWYHNEHADASDAIRTIRQKYQVKDVTIPIWTLYAEMDFPDKILFHATTMYSLPASNVYIRWTTFSFLALMAYLYLR